MRYAFLLMLCGCAAPHAYMDGAPLAPFEPRTIYTPVGTGLPEYWGAPESGPERSPHKRVLPETPDTRREPGIWAAGGGQTTGPSILGVELPGVPVEPEGYDYQPATACGDRWRRLFTRTGLAKHLLALTKQELRCYVAHMFEHCAFTPRLIESILSKSGLASLEARRWSPILEGMAEDFIARECKGGEVKEEHVFWGRALFEAYPKQLEIDIQAEANR